MIKNLYAIRDRVALAIIGGLHVFAHDAQAVRMFGDIAADPQTMIARRPEDYELVRCGSISESDEELRGVGEVHQYLGGPVVVITGAAWKASQERSE